MDNFTEEEWEEIQQEIDQASAAPKFEQLKNIDILKILEMTPSDETWLICLGRYRVKWKDRENFQTWWSPKIVWWIGKIDE